MSILNFITILAATQTNVHHPIQTGSATNSEIEIFTPKTKNLGMGLEVESANQNQKPQKPNVAKIPNDLKKQIEEFENSFNLDFFVTQMAPKMEKLEDGTIRSKYIDSNGNTLKEEIISPDRSSKSCTYFDESGNRRGFYQVKTIYDNETNQYYWMPNFINYEEGLATN